MSIVASSICLINHCSIPSDIANIIADYIGRKGKWTPYYDTNGILRWKINSAYFARVSETVSHKPVIVENFRSKPFTTVVINGIHQYTNSETVIISPMLLSPTEIQLYLYTKIEVEPEVFQYMMILCNWSFGETSSETHFIKGTLYCPAEPNEWNRRHTLTFVEIDNREIHVSHNQPVPQYEYNVFTNVGTLVFPTDEIPEPIWVHSP